MHPSNPAVTLCSPSFGGPVEEGVAVFGGSDRRRLCRSRARLCQLRPCVPPIRSQPEQEGRWRLHHLPGLSRCVDVRSRRSGGGHRVLLCLVFAITDPRNGVVPTSLQPLAIGLVVLAIGISWGGMHGYAINPARDFGPRLFTAVAGFQNTGFDSHVFMVPIVGPLAGGLIAAAVYDGMIRRYLPAGSPDADPGRSTD